MSLRILLVHRHSLVLQALKALMEGHGFTVVGQSTREEVDIVQKGKNHGWSYFEGSFTFRSGGPANTVFPIATSDSINGYTSS